MGGFGKRLRELRLKKDMSLRDLGQLSGLSYSYIGSLEKERFKPSRETVYSLAKALNHPADELLLLAGFAPESHFQTEKPSNTDDLESIFFYELEQLSDEDKRKALDHIRYLRYLAEQENKKGK